MSAQTGNICWKVAKPYKDKTKSGVKLIWRETTLLR